jgi:hypothetical protein
MSRDSVAVTGKGSQLSILIAHKNVRSRQLEADLSASSPTPIHQYPTL